MATENKYKVEFPLCYHPELMSSYLDQPRPEPTRTIGNCPIHNYVCPVCGFGRGSAPECDCPEVRY